MKKIILNPAWLTAAAMLLGSSGRLLAQAPGGNQLSGATANNPGYQPQGGASSAPLPRNKIGTINLMRVVKGYKKWGAFEVEYKNSYNQFNADFEKRKARGQELQQKLPTIADAKAREESENELKRIQREIQDLGEQAKKQLGKMNEDMSVLIYKEIEVAVAALARSNDLELVMHYNDAIVPTEMYSAGNVQRKLQAGPLVPIYQVPGMDLTDYIIKMLNDSYQPVVPTSGTSPRRPGQ